MLVLSRRTNERIQIGENVFVTLIRAENGKARIGIQAPDDVTIRRDELPKILPLPDRKANRDNGPTRPYGKTG